MTHGYLQKSFLGSHQRVSLRYAAYGVRSRGTYGTSAVGKYLGHSRIGILAYQGLLKEVDSAIFEV